VDEIVSTAHKVQGPSVLFATTPDDAAIRTFLDIELSGAVDSRGGQKNDPSFTMPSGHSTTTEGTV